MVSPWLIYNRFSSCGSSPSASCLTSRQRDVAASVTVPSPDTIAISDPLTFMTWRVSDTKNSSLITLGSSIGSSISHLTTTKKSYSSAIGKQLVSFRLKHPLPVHNDQHRCQCH